MPTGYTAQIEEGITFSRFAMLCARAFGASIDMRDEPLSKEIPIELIPSDHHQKALDKAIAELESLNKISIGEATLLAMAEFDHVVKCNQEYQNTRASLKGKYQAILTQVRAWNPPTSEHEELQKFMENQILESIKFDCGEYTEGTPVSMSGSEWIERKKNKILHDLCYHQKEYKEECRRVAGRNLWLKQLRESLKGYL
jgi:hypothetical protein